MRTQDEQIRSFKEYWKKDYNEDLTDAQALESSTNLLGVFEMLLKIDARIRAWDRRLIKEPKGFPVPSTETYDCHICRRRLSSSEGWYDQYGIKCPPCQKAVDDGVIPGTVGTDRDSWYSSDDLKEKFGWHHATIAKKVRIGELKARDIKDGGRHSFFLFLKEENPDL